MTTKSDRDRARIAELRRVARLAQGREVDKPSAAAATEPLGRWEPDRGPRFVTVGPGTPCLTPEEAESRLGLNTRELVAQLETGEVISLRVGWTWMVPLSEVERIERTVTSPG